MTEGMKTRLFGMRCGTALAVIALASGGARAQQTVAPAAGQTATPPSKADSQIEKTGQSDAQAAVPPSAGSPGDATAPTSQAAGTADIVVTAQRRSESVQKVPIAVTALGAAQLQSRGDTSIQSLSQAVPGLNVTEQLAQARVTLRGIGVDNISTGAESSVAFNQDGVFFARSGAALAGFYDVERVEVLRGPQGTLYGRNATGGSVNIITRHPTSTLEAGAALTIGNYDTVISEGYVSGPITDTLNGRVSFQTRNHSGYGENIVDGKDIDDLKSRGVRAQLEFKPSSRLSFLLEGDYYQSDDRSNGYHYFGPGGLTASGSTITPLGIQLGGYTSPSDRDIASGFDPVAHSKYYGGRLETRYELDDVNSIRAITAYRHSYFTSGTDIMPAAVPLFYLTTAERSNQFSQELQFNSVTSNNKLVAGVFYLHESVEGVEKGPYYNTLPLFPGILLNQFVQGVYLGGRLRTNALAGYAQDTYSVTDRLHLTLGGRFSYEKKSDRDQTEFDFVRPYQPTNQPLATPFIDSKSFKSFTPKVGVDFDLAPRVLLYASWSRGFKAGTYNLGNSGPPLSPEKLDAYEAGVKSTLFDGKLRANLAGFYYDYRDLQVGKVKTVGLVLENAAAARIYGLEGEFNAKPFGPDLGFDLAASWLHARFTKFVSADQARPAGDGHTVDEDGLPAFDLQGNSLPQAPNYTITLGAEYAFHLPFGTLKARAESYWSDRVYFTPFNRAALSQPAYNLQNAFLNLTTTNGKWVISGFAKNLSNKVIRASGQVATGLVGFPIIGYVQPPRTYGVTVSVKY